MKLRVFYCVLIAFVFLLTACNNGNQSAETEKEKQAPTVNDDPAQCFTTAERSVSDSTVQQWLTNWGEHWSGNGQANWPGSFEANLAAFVNLVSDYASFRIYYALCEINNVHTGYLLVAPLDNYCNPVLDGCVFTFDHVAYTGTLCTSDCNLAYTATTQTDAIAWTSEYRSTFGISTSDSIFEYNNETFLVPLAYTYNTQSVLDQMDTTQSDFMIYLGLEAAAEGEDVDWKLKLIIGDSWKGGIAYLDYAAPCPQYCGDKDGLLGTGN